MDEIDDMIAHMRRSYIEVGEEINPPQQQPQNQQQNINENKIKQKSEDKTYHIKLNFRDKFRRIQLYQCTFNALKNAITELYPDFRGGRFFYRDGEGDQIEFESDAEMVAMFYQIEANNKWKPISECDGTAKIFVEEFEKGSTDQPVTNNGQQDDKKSNKVLHAYIICDCCDGPIFGHRYKCLICPDFDLCEVCERTGVHTEHAMMRLVTPDTQRPSYLLPFFHPPRCCFKYGPGKKNKDDMQKEKSKILQPFDPNLQRSRQPLTSDERQKLIDRINDLPNKHLDGVAKICEAHCKNNEVELDFEKLPTTTLRAIEHSINTIDQIKVLKKEKEATKTEKQAEKLLRKQPELGHHVMPHHKHQHHHHKHHHGIHAGYPSMQTLDNQKIVEHTKRKQEQKLEKLGKKYVKQEQRCRDRVFRAMHRLERNGGSSTTGSQPFDASSNNNNINKGVEYLKQFGQHLQYALLNFGIDCEATIKDSNGNVQEHMPFIEEQKQQPNQNVRCQKNLLNQLNCNNPAGVFERPQLANIHSKASKKEKIKLAELRDSIQKADQLVVERKRAAASTTETEKTEKKKKEDEIKGQKQTEPQIQSQNPAMDEVLAQAFKTALEGIETATKVTTDVIKSFDPAAADAANQFTKKLVEEAKSGAENLLTNIDQSNLFTDMVQQFHNYLEQMQFPTGQHQENQMKQSEEKEMEPTNQNTQQSNQLQSENNGGNNSDMHLILNELKNVRESLFEKQQSNLVPKLSQLSLNNAEMPEFDETKKIEDESFLEIKKDEILADSTDKQLEEQKENTTEQKILTLAGNDSSASSLSLDDSVEGSDVEILNDEEEEATMLSKTKEQENLEVEPSLPGSSIVSVNGSLKRKVIEEKQHSLTDSVHTAIGIDEVVNEVITQNMQKLLQDNDQDDNGKIKSASRCSSISSLRSNSSITSSSSFDSGWMVVNKESFKRLCDFYEKRRRLEAPDGHGDTFTAQLEKERVEALNQTTQNEHAEIVANKQSKPVVESDSNNQKQRNQQQNERIIVDFGEEKQNGIDQIKKNTDEGSAKSVKEQSVTEVNQAQKEQNEQHLESANHDGNTNNNTTKTNNVNHTNNIPFYVADIVANLLGVPVPAARNAQNQQAPQQHAQPSAPPLNESHWPPQPSPAMLAAQSIANQFMAKNIEIPVIDKGTIPIPMPAPPLPTDNNVPVANLEKKHENKKEKKNNDKSNNNNTGTGLYPNLAGVDEICTAGLPHLRSLGLPSSSRHSRRCPWPHFDNNVQRIADQLIAMGYDNCNGWLYRIAEQANCELDRIFELIELDQQHKERQFLADV